MAASESQPAATQHSVYFTDVDRLKVCSFFYASAMYYISRSARDNAFWPHMAVQNGYGWN